MTEPVNVEIAKLLKEKGYNEPCVMLYTMGLEESNLKQLQYHLDYSYMHGERGVFIPIVDNYFAQKLKNEDHPAVPSAPTIAEVVMWLYEKHRIWIYVIYEKGLFHYNIQDTTYKDLLEEDCRVFNMSNYNSPTEAYEAAIEYTLNNLTPPSNESS